MKFNYPSEIPDLNSEYKQKISDAIERHTKLKDNVNVNLILNDIVESKKEFISTTFTNNLNDLQIGFVMPSIVKHKKYIYISFLSPFITNASSSLFIKLSQLGIMNKLNQKFIDLLIIGLLDDLYQISIKTIILEYNIYLLNNNIQQPTEVSLHNYLNTLKDESRLSTFLYEYSILTRSVQEICNTWVKSSEKVLKAFYNDFELIKRRFNLKIEMSDLILVQSKGDKHISGESVLLFKFKGDKKIYYKPRSAEHHLAFFDLLEYLNLNFEINYSLESNIIGRGSYYWAKHIAYKSCKHKSEIRQYYRRLGILQGILYLLNGSDIHYENIIADGEFPTIVDIECLFHPTMESTKSLSANSILSTLILPLQIKVGDKLMRLGAAQDVEGQTSPIKSFRVHGHKLIYKNEISPESINVPKIRNKKFDVLDFQEDFLFGLNQLLKLFLNHKTTLLEFIELKFKEVECRVLFRNTFVYKHLMNESCHPDYLRDGVERYVLFEHLRLNKPNRLYNTKILKYEIKGLLSGEVPYFSFNVSNCHLNAYGKVIPNFFKHSGLDLVRNKIRQIDLNSIAFQNYIAKMVFNSNRNIGWNTKNLDPEYFTSEKGIIYLEHLLSKEIFFSEKELFCLKIDKQNGIPEEMGSDLYSGYTGLSFLYVYLYKFIGKEEFKSKAYKAFNSIDFEKLSSQIGLFDGVSGYIYLCSHLYQTFNNVEYIEKGRLGINAVKGLIEDETNFDFLSGLSGCILAIGLFSKVDRHFQNEYIQLIKTISDKIIDNVEMHNGTASWRSKHLKKRLGGFSHGVSGIVYTLSKAYEFTKEKRLIKIIKSGLEYEKTLLIKRKNNWVDLRNQDHKSNPKFDHSWCNGSVGIGLARAAIRNNLICDSAICTEDLAIAMASLKDYEFGRNLCLCHGDLGVLELMKKTGMKECEIQNLLVKSVKSFIGGKVMQYNKPFANKKDVGLMTGLAGLIYQLIKLRDYSCIPSVLLAE